MSTSRRRFIAGASALAVASTLPGCGGDGGEPQGGPGPSPSPDRGPEPEPWVPDGQLDLEAFAWGVQAGDVTDRAALISVRTLEASVDLTVVVASDQGWVEHEVRAGLQPVDGVLQLELTGLRPDTAYQLALHSSDGTRRSPAGRIRTAPSGEGSRRLVFGATSCLGTDNPGWESLQRLAEEQLDFVLLLGDTVYADGAVSLEDYRTHWRRALSTPSLRSLLASTSLIAIWDDHEVANNWTLGEGDALQDAVTPEQLSDALIAFREALPQRRGSGGSGLWRRLSWGPDLDLFLLDCRGERDGAQIVSEEQLAWITAELRASSATFKVVASSVHLTDHDALMGEAQAQDRWQGYPAQRDVLLEAAVEVPGVVVLTGDMHYGALQRVDPVDGPAAELREIAAGPAGSGLFLVEALAALRGEVPPQYEILVEDWSSCLCVLDPGLGTLTVSFIADDGSVIDTSVLQLSEPAV
ncbi:MAG TPA: hypothetical protein ENK18_19140 [Deltaproteobacteria bacterium]|nr:hypothetical protein [Deltaproteobacteria bacterium]